MEYTKNTPGPWKIHPINIPGNGEFIIGKSITEDRPCEVVCQGILNPFDAQLIEIVPNMYGILKYISKLIEVNEIDEIKKIKESIDAMLNYAKRERNVKNSDE